MNLDISIPNAVTYINGPKNRPLTEPTQIRKATELLNEIKTVEEKIDGTKLTIVHTGAGSTDWKDNWIVSYKGDIIENGELDHITDEELEESIGLWQYRLVFDHLKKIDDKCNRFSPTEFSIEFAQRKPTLTRTYTTTGKLFLRSYAPLNRFYNVDGRLIVSYQSEETTHRETIEEMARFMGFEEFALWFNGSTRTKEQASMSFGISEIISAIKSYTEDWSDARKTLDFLRTTCLSIPSTLGGQCEGVVLTLTDGRKFKFVQDDQYSSNLRYSIKHQFQMDHEKESAYYAALRDDLQYDVMTAPNISYLGTCKASRRLAESHEKKTYFQVQEDAHETARLMYQKRYYWGRYRIGLISMAAKPFHKGHYNLIKTASEQNHMVVVLVSTKDRIKKDEFPIRWNEMAVIWGEYILPTLPVNVHVIPTDNPRNELFHELAWLNMTYAVDDFQVDSVRLYSDASEVDTSITDDALRKACPDLFKQGIVNRVGVERDETNGISGTKMRGFLKESNEFKFVENMDPISVPDALSSFLLLHRQGKKILK